jgi:hypothetical protein
MLEELLGKLKSEVGGKITSETHLPSGKLDNVMSVVGDVVKRVVSGQIMEGNISNLMNLFSDKPNTNDAIQIQSKLNSGVISELSCKVGLAPEMSKNIAGIVMPALINMITRKNNTTPVDDPSPLHELFGGTAKVGSVVKDLPGSFLKK